MLAPLPRLTSSLRAHFDADQAYLLRKAVLQARTLPRPHDEWELARRIVPNWDDAPSDVRQAYKQFIGAVVELLNGEVASEELRQVAQAVYRLFGAESDTADKPLQIRTELERIVGYTVQDSVSKKVAQLAQKLRSLQQVSGQEFVHEDAKDVDGDDAAEFGAGFDFKAPSRFIIDLTLDDDLPLDSGGLGSFENERHDAFTTSTSFSSNAVGGSVNLRWLKDQCDLITRSGGSMLSGDELASALCRVLRSDKAGDQVLL